MATDVDVKGLEETSRMLSGVHTHVGDVTKEEDVEALFAKARELMGGCRPLPSPEISSQTTRRCTA